MLRYIKCELRFILVEKIELVQLVSETATLKSIILYFKFIFYSINLTFFYIQNRRDYFFIHDSMFRC
jgi:hypothetical protein